MDAQQEEAILRAIVLSSTTTWSGQIISGNDRQAAFGILQDFSNFPGRIPLCLKWLPQNLITYQQQDCTLVVKLYACGIVNDFLKRQYGKFSDDERLALKRAVLQAAQLEATTKVATEPRMLANNLASLLAGLMIRYFPQMWPTCIEDLFGTLWSLSMPASPSGTPSQGADAQHTLYLPSMGVKMCLEILKLVAEDCTDSDFNAKVGRSNSDTI